MVSGLGSGLGWFWLHTSSVFAGVGGDLRESKVGQPAAYNLLDLRVQVGLRFIREKHLEEVRWH